jgi:hypothetical protein
LAEAQTDRVEVVLEKPTKDEFVIEVEKAEENAIGAKGGCHGQADNVKK